MPRTQKQMKIDELMEQASAALVRTAYFETERLALKALLMAREAKEWELMARILLPLQEARRQRLQQALDTGTMVIVEDPITEDMKVSPGCYIVGPPQVGADARRLRLLGLQQEVPLAVVCCEPMTRAGLCPIVAIAPGVTVRTKIRPPKNPDCPELAWFTGALEALGDAAIQSVDSGIEIDRRIDALLIRLDALPEHELLHQALELLCREAQHSAQDDAASVAAAAPDVPAATPVRPKTKS